MQQYITGSRVANDVMMLQRGHKGSIVVVEGPSDVRFYSKFFQANCRVVPAYKKGNVIDAIKLLDQRQAKGVLAIVDCDYAFLDNKLPKHKNLVFTDFHDIETLIVLSPALENILRELVPAESVHLLDTISQKARDIAFRLGKEIGYLRWVNDQNNFGLVFKDLPVNRFVNFQGKTIDRKKLIYTVKVMSKYQRLTVSDDEIEKHIIGISSRNADFRHVCQGHDLVLLLEFVIPAVFDETFGRNSGDTIRGAVRSTILAHNLRIGYEKAYFIKTKLYLSIKNWEVNNIPYIVLAA
jgi:hypothetical protein